MITNEYRETLLEMHSSTEWGTTGGVYSGDTVVEFLKACPDIRTILDYGCGEGSLKKWVEDAGITDKQWTLYDPGIVEFQDRPKGKFDLVITTDVLEHVEEGFLDCVIIDPEQRPCRLMPKPRHRLADIRHRPYRAICQCSAP